MACSRTWRSVFLIALVLMIDLSFAKRPVRKDKKPATGQPAEQGAGQDEGPEMDEGKITEMLTAVSKQVHVISVNDSTYPFFMLRRPRSFGLVVLFVSTGPNVEGPGVECTACRAMYPEYGLLAASYWLASDQNQVERASDAPPLFFAVADSEESPNMFRYHQISKVPQLMYLAPAFESEPPPRGALVAPQNVLPSTAEYVKAERIGDWLSARTRLKYPIYRDLMKQGPGSEEKVDPRVRARQGQAPPQARTGKGGKDKSLFRVFVTTLLPVVAGTGAVAYIIFRIVIGNMAPVKAPAAAGDDDDDDDANSAGPRRSSSRARSRGERRGRR